VNIAALALCSAELELLALLAAAVLEHTEAVDTLCNLVALGSKDKFAAAKPRTEQTASKYNAAKLALKKHHLEHNCVTGQVQQYLPSLIH